MNIDHIIVNANIHTLNPGQPHVSALAIVGERVVAMGDDDRIRALAGMQTQVTNAEGHTILPGFVDAHVHWEGYARSLTIVNLWEVPTKEEALRRIQEIVAQTPAGEWVLGFGWVQDMWENKAFPTKDDLDRIAPNHPVYLRAKSGHAAWVNSVALRMGNVSVATTDPPGGSIKRDGRGEPTGILFEDPAMKLVNDHVPASTVEQLVSWMDAAQANVLRMGLTGFHDFDDPTCMEALQVMRERDELGLRVVKQINQEWFEHALELGIRSGFGDDWLRFGGLKLFADGALGSRTALMIEAYEGEPDNYGIAVVDKEDMQEMVTRATRKGLMSTIHAIGDKAVHDVLDVFEVARRHEQERGIYRDERRHRIEHVQLIHPQDVTRLAELDIIASMQPIHATGDYEMADAYWGERAEYSYAWRKQLNAGARLIFGSDAPIEPIEPLKGIHAAVTRRRANGLPGPDGWYPQERLNLREAIHAYTMGPAYAAGMEDRAGMLAVNYLADLIVLDQDLFNVPPMDILDVAVLGTMVGGLWRYRNFG